MMSDHTPGPGGEGRLAAERLWDARQPLLSLRIDDVDLGRATRNAGWTVRHVLAHLLATDADLIWLLENLELDGRRAPHLTEEFDRQEMERSLETTADGALCELRRRAESWRRLLHGLHDDGLDAPVRVWWRRGHLPLRDALRDWYDHDRQHAEDIRIAIDG
jgi:hypothetical protein